MRVRREVVEGGTKLQEYARAEADTKLRYQPGFVAGKDERFTGRLSGVVLNYEYTHGGKPMAGRVYYLTGRRPHGLRAPLHRPARQAPAHPEPDRRHRAQLPTETVEDVKP